MQVLLIPLQTIFPIVIIEIGKMFNPLKKLPVRCGIAAAIVFGILVLDIYYQVPEDNYRNLWALAGALTSALITGIIFLIHIVIMSLRHSIEYSYYKLYILAVTFSFIIFILTLLFSIIAIVSLIQNPNNPINFIYYWALLLPLLVLIEDILLKKTQHYPLMEIEWTYIKLFDGGILFATAFIFVISLLLEDYFPDAFSGGALAFELILANVLFDPIVYTFLPPEKKKDKFKCPKCGKDIFDYLTKSYDELLETDC